MRKLFVHLLMLLMLTPSLACGPFMGEDKAQAATAMPGMEDCHGMEASNAGQTDKDNHFFFKDCYKVDLQSADQSGDLKSPDIFSRIFTVIWTASVPVYDFTGSATNAIRGPPPEWPVFSQTQPAILLTTQRLRV